jgi:uncharacterized Ntn-hydrolase superfamily protein
VPRGSLKNGRGVHRSGASGQMRQHTRSEPAAVYLATFSIVGMDPETREWGVAVASRVLDVGYLVPWLKAEVGGVASQALSNPHLGPWALEILAGGTPANAALKAVLARDSSPEDRQVGIVDREGNSAAHTGKGTLDWAGHRTARWVSVQGNILAGPAVVDAMLEKFQETKGVLGARLLAALEAGEKAGGDKRGKQSAALYVVKRGGGYQGVDDRLVDLKVVDTAEPILELRRQYGKWQYAYMVPSYSRLADEEPERKTVLLGRVQNLLASALASDLRDPEAFNSLAWELAVRREFPEQTLAAARRAHDLAPEAPHIMDTLAEAHYAAGMYDEAIHWEQEALRRTPDDGFLKKQLARFELRGKE